MKTILFLTRVYFKFLNAIDSKTAGKKAFRLFQKTNLSKIKPKEKKYLLSSSTFKIQTEFGKIACYENGDPQKSTFLLVHGWNSNAGSLGLISDELVKKGYHTISFDLPAHGNNSNTHTNLLECKEVMKTILKRIRTSEPISIISHSFGSLITSYALSELSIQTNHLVFLTSPQKSKHIFDFFKETVQLSDKAYHHMITLASNLLKEPLSKVNACDKLLLANFNHLTLIHEKKDKVLPFQNSVFINENIENSTLVALEKVGHYRMLWNNKVLEEIMKAVQHSMAKKDEPIKALQI